MPGTSPGMTGKGFVLGFTRRWRCEAGSLLLGHDSHPATCSRDPKSGGWDQEVKQEWLSGLLVARWIPVTSTGMTVERVVRVLLVSLTG